MDLFEARIIPVRQEQLKERLGDRFRELDTPLLVEWPDGRREGILFVVEEESKTSEFSIYRLARYCLDLAELMGTPRAFLRLGSDSCAYMEFRYLMCNLKNLLSVEYYDSDNIVARLNLPNMAYPPENRLEMYLAAQTGLAKLETSLEKQRKYADFIDFYADLSEEEVIRYRDRYLNEKGNIMGLASVLREEGREEGIEQGMQQGMQQGAIKLLSRQIARRFRVSSNSVYPMFAGLNTEQLEELGERFFEAESLDEIRGWAEEKRLANAQ